MILVTGGTGMLGSHLLSELTKYNSKVKAIKRKNSNLSIIYSVFKIYNKNYEELLKKIEWIDADITDYESIIEEFTDITEVYHCAAFVSFQKKDKNKIFETNIKGTANIVNACLEKKVNFLCYVSSVAALGHENELGFVDEGFTKINLKKTSKYSQSKYLAEYEVWRGISEGLNAVIVNPSVIIGLGNWSEGSASFIKTVHQGLKFYSNGITGFVDVIDVVSIMLELSKQKISGERFILNSENISYKKLFEIIADNLNCKAPSINANRFLLYTAFLLDRIGSILLFKKQKLSVDIINSAFSKSLYSSKKIEDKLNFKFLSISKSIEKTAKIYLTQ